MPPADGNKCITLAHNEVIHFYATCWWKSCTCLIYKIKRIEAMKLDNLNVCANFAIIQCSTEFLPTFHVICHCLRSVIVDVTVVQNKSVLAAVYAILIFSTVKLTEFTRDGFLQWIWRCQQKIFILFQFSKKFKQKQLCQEVHLVAKVCWDQLGN